LQQPHTARHSLGGEWFEARFQSRLEPLLELALVSTVTIISGP
jgi:hypothetical protein